MAGGGWQRRKVWRRCRRIARTLPASAEFDDEALTTVLSQRLGRPVVLLPLPSSACSPCGLLVTTDHAEYIGYPSDTTPLHQRHIVMHEVGHLLCGHRGSSVLGTAAASALLPNLSDELIRRVLGRTGYTEIQEREAEIFASLVLHRAALRRPVPPAAGTRPEDVNAAARLRSLFDPGADIDGKTRRTPMSGSDHW